MTHAGAESRDRAVWYFFTAQITPTLSRRQEMYARAARASAATVISNLDPDRAVLYFFTAQLMRVGATTVILNSNSHTHTVWRIISRTQSSVTPR